MCVTNKLPSVSRRVEGKKYMNEILTKILAVLPKMLAELTKMLAELQNVNGRYRKY